jgi:4-amino-4-deoxy-L-arabinose transferase-like glycosyltransferase
MLGTLLRLWMLGSKGLWYDEASTALMARAVPGQIIQFHWNAAFEHPPLWILLIHFWSKLFGQGEATLRVPSALAGALVVPLTWQVARAAWPGPAGRTARLVASGLVATSPVLILYSQEARMYSLVVCLALASAYLATRLLAKPGVVHLAVFVLVNWVMLGLHYYSILLIGIETAFLLAYALHRRRLAGEIALAVGLSVLPFLLWAWLAPGFHTTVGVVLREAGGAQRPWFPFLDGLWRDLTFGSVRWQPPRAAAGYLLLPFLLLGAVQAFLRGGVHGRPAPPPDGARWGILFVMILVLPVMGRLALAGGVATRYILWVVPFAYLLIALGISALWRQWPSLGVAGLLLAGLVAGLGLDYYFTSYQKSEYREMATYLASQMSSGDAVVLEAPRQHLLAKYYMPSAGNLYPMSAIDLPDYWPVTAPPVVPEEADHQLQAILEKHGRAWLVLTGEDEVDRGEFVARYLTAIAYPRGCRQWLDVRLCEFVSPGKVSAEAVIPLDVAFHGGLELREVEVGVDAPSSGERFLFVSPQWYAQAKPAADYKVTLRLLDRDGNLVSQSDSFPIGPLLPPGSWNAGDDKPGYMGLPLPASLAPGQYRLALGLYDPASGNLVQFSGMEPGGSGLLELAHVEVDGTVRIAP